VHNQRTATGLVLVADTIFIGNLQHLISSIIPNKGTKKFLELSIQVKEKKVSTTIVKDANE